jgi:predicted enzyme related to lactoylglutathione lyase
MTEQTTTTGTFIWNELGTGDLAAGRAFYTQLFGWGCEETPMPGDGPGVYALFKLGDVDIGGGYQLDGEMFEGVPPHWACYVSVDDVDATMAAAVKAGGKTLWPAMDIPGIGRMGGFSDPTGAALAIFKMGDKEERPDLGAATGCFCWNELATNDTDAAAAFYNKVFGWTADSKGDDSPMPYSEWKLGDKSLGGMLKLDPAWGPIPPYWAVYVSGADCDATVAKALELGAEIKAPAMDIPGVGRFACLADPTGAVLSVITLSATEGCS